MPTETTASLLIGPLDTHWGASVFGPDHVLLLREGSRATWVLTSLAPDRPASPAFIRPASPDHILAAGILGFASLVVPHLLDGAPQLGAAVEQEPDGVAVGEVSVDLARRVFAWSSEWIDGLGTVLAGSSIGVDELRLAASHGLRLAVAEQATAAGGAR